MPRLIDLGPIKGQLKPVARNQRHEDGGLVVIFQPDRKFDPAAPSCLECGPSAIGVLVTGKEVYPHRSNLWHKQIWRCPNDPLHYVGTHDGTTIRAANGAVVPAALGFMIGKAGRHWRMEAHKVFDPIWMRRAAKYGESKGKARNFCYDWLAKKMGRSDVHISQLTVAELRQVVDICRPITERIVKGEL